MVEWSDAVKHYTVTRKQQTTYTQAQLALRQTGRQLSELLKRTVVVPMRGHASQRIHKAKQLDSAPGLDADKNVLLLRLEFTDGTRLRVHVVSFPADPEVT